MAKSSKPRKDVYEEVTNKIVEALEAGANGNAWRAPWHATGGLAFDLPVNISTKKHYRGVNTWVLLSEQFLKGYAHPLWGTYKQWKDKGAQVRRRPDNVPEGEWGTTVILWKPTERKVKNDAGETETKKALFAGAFTVFNVDQVDGYTVPVTPVEKEPQKQFEVIEHAQHFFTEIGAKVRHGGARAYYSPSGDFIGLPNPEDFTNNVAYYATSAHEHVHWTGAEKRCNREFGDRFGNDKYAVEELVAELGSAYVCGILGLSNEPREDHAQYLASWIKVLKADPKAIITASKQAQLAVDYLVEHAGESSTQSAESAEEVEERVFEVAVA